MSFEAYKLGSTKGASDVDALVAEPFSFVALRGMSVEGFEDLGRYQGSKRLFAKGSEPTVVSSWVYAERYRPTFHGP